MLWMRPNLHLGSLVVPGSQSVVCVLLVLNQSWVSLFSKKTVVSKLIRTQSLRSLGSSASFSALAVSEVASSVLAMWRRVKSFVQAVYSLGVELL